MIFTLTIMKSLRPEHPVWLLHQSTALGRVAKERTVTVADNLVLREDETCPLLLSADVPRTPTPYLDTLRELS